MVKARYAILFVLLLLPACGNLLAPAAAVVHGQKIPISDVERALHDFEESPQFEELATGSTPADARRRFEQAYLSSLIRRELLRREAEGLDISVSEAEIEEGISDIKEKFPSEADFNEALEEKGLDLAELEELVADHTLEQKLRTKVVGGATGPDADEIWQKWLVEVYEDGGIKVNPRYGHLDITTQRIETLGGESFPGVPKRKAIPTSPAP